MLKEKIFLKIYCMGFKKINSSLYQGWRTTDPRVTVPLTYGNLMTNSLFRKKKILI